MVDFQPSPMVCGGREYKKRRGSASSLSSESTENDPKDRQNSNKRIRKILHRPSTEENLLTVNAELEIAKEDLVKAQARTDMSIEEMRLARMEEEVQEMRCEMLRERGIRMEVDLRNGELEGKVRGLEKDLEGRFGEVGRLNERIINIENDKTQLHAEVNMLKVNHQRSIDNFRSLQRQEIAQLKAQHLTDISKKDREIVGLKATIESHEESAKDMKDQIVKLRDWVQSVNFGSGEILKSDMKPL